MNEGLIEQVVAVVLAGGLGTRVRHLLPDLPKPMAPVAGRPFLEWVLRYLARQGLRRVILSTGHLADAVQRYFAGSPVGGLSVKCVPETRPLGTAGGFLNAISTVAHTPPAWLVLNGDSLALGPLARILGLLDKAEVDGAVLGVPMSDASRYGTIALDDKGWLIGFKEKQPGSGIINAGVYLFRSRTVQLFPSRLPLSFETEVFPELLAKGARLKVCVTDAPFLDIGTPESLGLADEFVRRHAELFA